MNERLSLEVRNTRESIAPAIKSAEAWLEAKQASPKVTFFVALVIEELALNCIHYGYDDEHEHIILITLVMDDDALTMQIVDDGMAFDPLAAPAPDLSTNVQDRPVGGLGIHLLRNLADHMLYEHRDGTNRITLVKKLR